jgi:hypothetical protein
LCIVKARMLQRYFVSAPTGQAIVGPRHLGKFRWRRASGNRHVLWQLPPTPTLLSNHPSYRHHLSTIPIVLSQFALA